MFSTTCHPQTDVQTKVVNGTLGNLLRTIVKSNVKSWDECLPHIEFTYNSSPHFATKICPFETIYSFIPMSLIDFLPLLCNEYLNGNDRNRTEYMKALHKKVKANLEKTIETYAKYVNRERKKVNFQTGDWM